jgi:hypothetical protein
MHDDDADHSSDSTAGSAPLPAPDEALNLQEPTVQELEQLDGWMQKGADRDDVEER